MFLHVVTLTWVFYWGAVGVWDVFVFHVVSLRRLFLSVRMHLYSSPSKCVRKIFVSSIGKCRAYLRVISLRLVIFFSISNLNASSGRLLNMICISLIISRPYLTRSLSFLIYDECSLKYASRKRFSSMSVSIDGFCSVDSTVPSSAGLTRGYRRLITLFPSWMIGYGILTRFLMTLECAFVSFWIRNICSAI